MDKDAHLIFESYLNQKITNPILEADEKKWEDESSAWAWLKALDPTGISSWPDVYDSAIEVYNNKKDIWPWAKLFINIFLALPNLGLLAMGGGAAGWQALRVLSKAAIKGGEKEGFKVAEKICKMIGESDIMRAAFEKIAKQLEKEGIITVAEFGPIRKKLMEKGVLAAGEKGALAGREALVGKAVRSSIQDTATLSNSLLPLAGKFNTIKTAAKGADQLGNQFQIDSNAKKATPRIPEKGASLPESTPKSSEEKNRLERVRAKKRASQSTSSSGVTDITNL